MDTTPETSESSRIERQLAELGSEPTELAQLKVWEEHVLDTIFGGHTRGCDCLPCFTCIHDPEP